MAIDHVQLCIYKNGNDEIDAKQNNELGDKTMRIPLINVHSPFTSHFKHSIRQWKGLAEGGIVHHESHNNNNKK